LDGDLLNVFLCQSEIQDSYHSRRMFCVD